MPLTDTSRKYCDAITKRKKYFLKIKFNTPVSTIALVKIRGKSHDKNFQNRTLNRVGRYQLPRFHVTSISLTTHFYVQKKILLRNILCRIE